MEKVCWSVTGILDPCDHGTVWGKEHFHASVQMIIINISQRNNVYADTVEVTAFVSLKEFQ
jgi:hypothetical protein